MKSIRKWEKIHIYFGNPGSIFEITASTSSEEVLRLYAKEGCEFVPASHGAPQMVLTCPV